MNSKTELREIFLKKKAALSTKEWQYLSTHICKHVTSVLNEHNVNTVVGYLAKSNELNIDTVLHTLSNKTIPVYVPIYQKGHYQLAPLTPKTQLKSGPYGIREPISGTIKTPHEVDSKNTIWLVPGNGFSTHGHRIGYGKGIYDTLLSHAIGTKIGIGIQQCVGVWEPENHDIAMDIVVTEVGIL